MSTNAKISQIKDHYFHNDLKKLLDYVYHDEQLHYIGCPSRNHIYLIIRRLAKHIGYKS